MVYPGIYEDIQTGGRGGPGSIEFFCWTKLNITVSVVQETETPTRIQSTNTDQISIHPERVILGEVYRMRNLKNRGFQRVYDRNAGKHHPHR